MDIVTLQDCLDLLTDGELTKTEFLENITHISHCNISQPYKEHLRAAMKLRELLIDISFEECIELSDSTKIYDLVFEALRLYENEVFLCLCFNHFPCHVVNNVSIFSGPIHFDFFTGFSRNMHGSLGLL